MKYKILEYDEGFPMLRIYLPEDREIEFSFAGVAPESQEWLAEHLTNLFHVEIYRAKKVAVADLQRQLRHLLGAAHD